jgi:hypothetical protein
MNMQRGNRINVPGALHHAAKRGARIALENRLSLIDNKKGE